MKKITLLFVVPLFFCFSAWGASSEFEGQASSPQYYQQADEPINPLQKNQKSPAEQALRSDDSDSDATTANDSNSDAANKADNQSLAVLQAELSQINQNYVMFQQKTDDRFLDLSSKYQNLKQKIDQLNQAVGFLNREISQMSAAAEQQQPQSTTQAKSSEQQPMSSTLTQILSSPLFKWILAGTFLVILLLAWAFWPKEQAAPTTKKKPHAKEEDTDTKDEYDYMGSVESVPAKLDLARTYIAMEDYRAARAVLREVMKQGNDKQCDQAKNLLDKIPTS